MKEENLYDREELEVVQGEEEINQNLVDMDDIPNPNDVATENMQNIAGVLSAKEKKSNLLPILVTIGLIVLIIAISYGIYYASFFEEYVPLP